MIRFFVHNFAVLLWLSSLVSSEKLDDISEENYASDLYYQHNQPYRLQHYQQPEQSHGVPSFTGGFGSCLQKQDGFVDDSSVFIAIAAVAVLGIGVIGAFAVANELQNLRNDIESNDGDISTLQTRTNGACNALNTIGNIGAVPTGLAADMGQNAIAINAIIAAANGANCT